MCCRRNRTDQQTAWATTHGHSVGRPCSKKERAIAAQSIRGSRAGFQTVHAGRPCDALLLLKAGQSSPARYKPAARTRDACWRRGHRWLPATWRRGCDRHHRDPGCDRHHRDPGCDRHHREPGCDRHHRDSGCDRHHRDPGGHHDRGGTWPCSASTPSRPRCPSPPAAAALSPKPARGPEPAARAARGAPGWLVNGVQLNPLWGPTLSCDWLLWEDDVTRCWQSRSCHVQA